MGIANPVTRETHGSGTHYHLQLAKQLGDMLQAPLEVGVSCVLVSSSHFILSDSDFVFLPRSALSGAGRYDGSHRGVLSRQPCQRDGGNAHISAAQMF